MKEFTVIFLWHVAFKENLRLIGNFILIAITQDY